MPNISIGTGRGMRVSRYVPPPPAAPGGLVAYGGQGGAVVKINATPGALSYDFQGSNDGLSWSDVSLAQPGTSCPDTTGYAHYRARANGITGSSGAYSSVAAVSPLPNVLTWLRCGHGFTPPTWADQGGAGHDATQATSGRQFAASGTLGTKTVVTAVDDTRIMNFGNILPTVASWTFAILFKASGAGHGNLFGGSLNTGRAYLSVADGSLLLSQVFTDNSGDTNLISIETDTAPGTGWNLLIYTLNGTTSNFQPSFVLNGLNAGIGAIAGPYTAENAELSIGGIQNQASLGFTGSFAEFLLSSTATGIDGVNNVIDMVNATYDTTYPTMAKQVMGVGNSITAGGQATWSGGSWFYLLSRTDSSKYYLNKGWAGKQVSDFIGNASTNLYPCLSSSKQTTITIDLGVNDLVIGGKTGTTIYADMVTLVTGIKTANPGGPLKFVGITPTPCGSGHETERQNLCNLMMADASGIFDAKVDLRTDAVGAPGANTDTSLYDVDAIHPKDTGHARIAAVVGPVISAIW